MDSPKFLANMSTFRDSHAIRLNVGRFSFLSESLYYYAYGTTSLAKASSGQVDPPYCGDD